jgi:DNA-binding Lrp family transcriptional regulator
MEKMKTIDYKLLWELMKNSRNSDRQLARSLGTSQPTVTRRRTILEKSFIEGYTDYNSEKLKEIYERVNLMVLE